LTADDERLARLLEEIRDLHREEVRLRQVGLDEQRVFQERTQTALAAAERKQRLGNLVLICLLAFLAFGWLLGPSIMGVISLFQGLPAGASSTDALVPSVVDTDLFDGNYVLDLGSTIQLEPNAALRDANQNALRGLFERQYPSLQIREGVIRVGGPITQEFSLIEGVLEGTTMTADAIWHEDVYDPGDSSTVKVMLRRLEDVLHFALVDDQDKPDFVLVYRRK
jgi:hypothetical protein